MILRNYTVFLFGCLIFLLVYFLARKTSKLQLCKLIIANLVSSVSSLVPGGGKMRDPENEVGLKLLLVFNSSSYFQEKMYMRCKKKAMIVQNNSGLQRYILKKRKEKNKKERKKNSCWAASISFLGSLGLRRLGVDTLWF